ncbi:MAG: flagellar basal body-associated FliL family protein [Deltaproteobacteria bacterium]|nr:flagellar basal body-associated FliL family protein [Deltaproteobacteria bacterium]
MSEDAGHKKEEETAHPPKSSNKLLLIIIGVLVLIILVGGGFFVFSKMGGGKDKAADAETTAEEKSGHEADKKSEKKSEKKDTNAKKEDKSGQGGKVELMALDPFIVNLQDSTGTRYLKVTINLDLETAAMEEAKAKTAQIKDAIIILLSSKGYADVGSIQGKYQLRDEIVARVNQTLTKGKLKSVYFTEFVIQ